MSDSEKKDGPIAFYPGVGSDQARKELNELVGDITATWACVEDGLFNVFVVALYGTFLIEDLRPCRSVFFTFSAYEGKMRMVNNAMKTRFADRADILDEWRTLKKALDGFAALRNEVAHLVPMAKSSTDPNTPANVRLMPPFWKSGPSRSDDFDHSGYSKEELWQALRPYWGYNPNIPMLEQLDVNNALGYRLSQFSMKLDPEIHKPVNISQ